MRLGALVNAGLVAVGLLFALAVGEVAVRVMNLEPPALWEFNRTIGWSYQPGLRTWYSSPEFNSWVEINSRGLHDREHPYGKPAGVYRILLLGDSFTAALEVPFESSFARRLEKRLNEKAPGRFEVINAGVGGFSTVNELLMFREEGAKYRPDLVLLCFVDADIRDNFHLTADATVPGSPYFVLADGKLELQHHPTGVMTSAKRLVGRLRVVRLAYRMWASFGPGRAEADPTDEGGSHRLSMNTLYSETRPPEWAQAIAITRALMTQLDREVSAAGGRLAIVSLGSMEGEAIRRKAGKPELGPERELGELFESLRIPHVFSVGCLYDEETARGQVIRFKRDRHLNVHGHQMVARHVEGLLAENGLLPASAERRESAQIAVKSRTCVGLGGGGS
jgi:hypothetical protein